MSIDFNLPRSRFVDELDISDQYQKICEECRKVGHEMDDVVCAGYLIADLVQQDFKNIAREAVDLMQAVQTLLHILTEKHGVDVQKIIVDRWL